MAALDLTALPFSGQLVTTEPGPQLLGAIYGAALAGRFELANGRFVVVVFGDQSGAGTIVGRETPGGTPPFTVLGGYFTEWGGLGVSETLLGQLQAPDGSQALLVFQEIKTMGQPNSVEVPGLRAILVSSTAREIALPRALPDEANIEGTNAGARLVAPCQARRQRIFRFDFQSSKLIAESSRACAAN